MYLVIDRKEQMEFQTDLKPIINVIKNKIESFDWLISFHEFYYLIDSEYDERLNAATDLIRISGKELVEIVNKYDIQFVWGVLSAKKNLPQIEYLEIEKLNLKNYSMPAYVYEEAELEIDCFDSSYTVIRSEDYELMKTLSQYFNAEIKSE